jgi:protein arginine kinase
MAIEILLNRNAEWLRGAGPEAKIVVSSRLRFARNISGFAFPGRAKAAARKQVRKHVEKKLGSSRLMHGSLYVHLDELEELDRQFLVERHLISREHARGDLGGALAIDNKEVISLMINEEDHLRMQVLYSGFQLREALSLINRLDDEMEAVMNYAFLPSVGYLTACPTNVGTALRASVMLHLPGLVFVNQINQVLQAIVKLGLAVRGLYGEGTEASGNLFQISNQVTLGITEEDIVTNLQKVINQIIGHEKKARQALYQKNRKALEDRVCRAYGLLSSARIISSKETIDLLSTLKLGLDFQLADFDLGSINELFIITQPAHLQKQARKELKPEERDILRADLIREKLWAKKKREKGNKS